MEMVFIIVFAGMGLAILILLSLFILKRMKGSLEIIPESYQYTPGDTIKGKLALKLKKSVSSSGLVMGLRCERRQESASGPSGRSQSHVSVLFDFNQPLEGKKEYAPSEYTYDFSLKIPSNVSQQIDGVAGTLVKSLQALTGQSGYVKWYLYAELQCTGVNLSKKVSLNIA